MSKTGEIGKLGEGIACRYLVQKGYVILDKNFREKWGEIDVIARAPDSTLVFVEVKAMKDGFGLMPEDHLHNQKLIRLQRICQSFAHQNEKLINLKYGWRIDLVAITLPQEGIAELLSLTETMKKCLINHYKNI